MKLRDFFGPGARPLNEAPEDIDPTEKRFEKRRTPGPEVKDKAGKKFYVLGTIPNDPDEPIKQVIISSVEPPKPPKADADARQFDAFTAALRDLKKSITKVPYKEFLRDYKRTGSLKTTPISPAIRSWAAYEGGAELEKAMRAGKQLPTLDPKGYEAIGASAATKGRGAVDIDPETGEWVNLPTKRNLEQPLSAAGVRLEDEKTRDKVDLVMSNPDLFRKMTVHVIQKYKDELEKSIVVAKKAATQYWYDIVHGDPRIKGAKPDLDPEEVQWMKSTEPAILHAAIWELPSFREHILPEFPIPTTHESSISAIVARTGRLDPSQLVNNKAVDEAIRMDPGFLVYLGSDKFWDQMRNAAEERGTYRGQF